MSGKTFNRITNETETGGQNEPLPLTPEEKPEETPPDEPVPSEQ